LTKTAFYNIEKVNQYKDVLKTRASRSLTPFFILYDKGVKEIWRLFFKHLKKGGEE